MRAFLLLVASTICSVPGYAFSNDLFGEWSGTIVQADPDGKKSSFGTPNVFEW